MPPVGAVAWDRIDAASRSGVRVEAEAVLRAAWPDLPRDAWDAFFRSGTRTTFETPYFERRRRLSTLALAAATEAGTLFGERCAEAMIDGLRLVLDEPTWCVPAHNAPPGGTLQPEPDPARPVLDLFAAESAALLAWLLTLHRHTLPVELTGRIASEIDIRVLTPFEQDAPRYHWFALPSNWNPWVVSNVLACVSLVDVDPARRAAILRTAIRSLDPYLAGVPQDGGCTEGVMYWWQSAARLFEAVEMLGWYAPTGADAVFRHPLLRALARYPMVVALGPDGWSAVFGDGSARRPRAGGGSMKDRHPGELLWRFGQRTGDSAVARFARETRGAGPAVELPLPLGRALLALLDESWRDAPASPPSAPAPVLLPESQVFAAASGPLRLVAKGGHNGEPHNHNDVGSFVVAADGAPLLIDVGSGVYTASSFTAARYNQWFTTSGFHSVPRINGVEQPPGAEFGATVLSDEREENGWAFTIDLAPAYPPDAGVTSWIRRFERIGTSAIRVTDAWPQALKPREIELVLMLARVPVLRGEGEFGLRAPDGDDVRAVLSVDPSARTTVDTIRLDDPLLRAVWGEEIARVIVRPMPGVLGASVLVDARPR